jgi:uncharacterized OB-fold protein
VEISGKGRVAGAAVLHRAFDPAFAADIPITLAHVEMDGTDQRMVLIGNLVPAISAAQATGARVKVGFKSSPSGILPVFQLSGESDDI